jgi:hypothetical protein
VYDHRFQVVLIPERQWHIRREEAVPISRSGEASAVVNRSDPAELNVRVDSAREFEMSGSFVSVLRLIGVAG